MEWGSGSRAASPREQSLGPKSPLTTSYGSQISLPHYGFTPHSSAQLWGSPHPLTQALSPPGWAPLTWDDGLPLILNFFCPGHPLGSTLGLQAAAQVPAAPGPAPSSLLLGLQGQRLGHSACYYCLLFIVQRLLDSCREEKNHDSVRQPKPPHGRGNRVLEASPSSAQLPPGSRCP